MTTSKAPSIADIKKRIQEQKNKTSQYKSTVDKTFYPFWLMKEGEQSIVRILPDTNSENPLPYFVDSFNHVLSIDGEDKKIACPKTFDRATACPICELSQKYYREGDKVKGKYFWRNKNTFVRLLVLSSPLDVKDENGEPVNYVGRVCTSIFGKQILQAIEQSLTEFDDDQPVPWMIDDGYDFIIKKVANSSGDPNETHATYAFSKFAHKSSGVAEEYKATVLENLIDFNDMLPDNPPLEKVQNYLDAHHGQADFLYGPQATVAVEADAGSAAAPAAPVVQIVPPAVPAPAPAAVAPVAPEAEPIASESTVTLTDEDNDEDVIAKILNRQR